MGWQGPVSSVCRVRSQLVDPVHGLVNWREMAGCRDADPDLFFPNGIGMASQVQSDRAKAVCHGCLVVDRCLAFALRSGQDEGIWGGLTPEERQQSRRSLGQSHSNSHTSQCGQVSQSA